MSRALEIFAANPDRGLLALDVDGTLAPITSRPELSQAVDGSAQVLEMLVARGLQVVLISGRPATDAVRIVGLPDESDVVVFGQYGAERWARGLLSSPEPVPGVALARRRLLQALPDWPDGVHVEDKGLAVVVHTRPARDPQSALEEIRPAVEAIAASAGLQAIGGRLVIELRPPGSGKGAVLDALVAQWRPEAVVFAGDDEADLDAFAALDRARAAGVATLAVASVAAGDTDLDPRVAERAELVLDGPKGVFEWLRVMAMGTG